MKLMVTMQIYSSGSEILDELQYTYDPSLNTTSILRTTAGNTMHCVEKTSSYTGYQYDSVSELYFAQARHYDPISGRFNAKDLLHGLLDKSETLNRYTYCLGNPVKHTDPSGLAIKIPILGGLLSGGGSGGAAAGGGAKVAGVSGGGAAAGGAGKKAGGGSAFVAWATGHTSKALTTGYVTTRVVSGAAQGAGLLAVQDAWQNLNNHGTNLGDWQWSSNEAYLGAAASGAAGGLASLGTGPIGGLLVTMGLFSSSELEDLALANRARREAEVEVSALSGSISAGFYNEHREALIALFARANMPKFDML